MVRLSLEKLQRFHPQLFVFWGFLRSLYVDLGSWRGYDWSRRHIAEWLYHGDSRAAVVVSTAPLIGAAYTDELDCVVLLRFPDELVEEYDLAIGSRLLAANTYEPRSILIRLRRDLTDGPQSYRRHANVHSLIADFLSDDFARIEQRKAEIDEEEWTTAYRMGMECLTGGVPPRDGRPLNCGRPRRRW